MTPTLAPASCASIAARIPAQPAPTTRTSCVASISLDPRPGCGDVGAGVLELDEVLAEHLRELLRTAVVGGRIAPRPGGIQRLRVGAGNPAGSLEAEHLGPGELPLRGRAQEPRP